MENDQAVSIHSLGPGDHVLAPRRDSWNDTNEKKVLVQDFAKDW